MRQIARSLLMMILGLLTLGATAEAAVVSIDVDPNRAGIQDKIKVQLGDTVTVDVVVDDVSNLNAFQFDLRYPATKLNATVITSGNFLPGTPSTLNEDLGPPLLKYNEFIFSAMGSSGTDVVLASITFTAVRKGKSRLDLPVVRLAAPHGVSILNGVGTGGKIRVVSKRQRRPRSQRGLRSR